MYRLLIRNNTTVMAGIENPKAVVEPPENVTVISGTVGELMVYIQQNNLDITPALSEIRPFALKLGLIDTDLAPYIQSEEHIG